MTLVDALDAALAAHPLFGDSTTIDRRTDVRYDFGLELLGLAEHVTMLDEVSRRRLFRDPVLRIVLEQAFANLERGAAVPERLESLLALAVVLAPDDRTLLESELDLPRVGPGRGIRVWSFGGACGDAVGPLVRDLESRFDREMSYEGARPGTIHAPTPEMLRVIDDACALLIALLPRTGASVLGHIAAIAVVDVEEEGKQLMSASGGDSLPATVFLAPAQLSNPWDVAGLLLHEGLHLKLFDVARTHSLIVTDAPAIAVPWHTIQWSVVRTLFAFHVYAHLEVFQEAVRRRPPALVLRHGDPASYVSPEHAMSVIKRDASGPFDDSLERTRFLGDQLATAWSRHLTTHGRALVSWLLDTVAPVVAWTPAAERSAR